MLASALMWYTISQRSIFFPSLIMELIIHARSVYVLESFPALEVGNVLYVDLAVVLGGYAVEMYTLD